MVAPVFVYFLLTFITTNLDYLSKMAVFKKFREFIGKRFFSTKEIDPESAYNLWSRQYDDQPDNLMLALDEEIFIGLINNISLTDKIILDVGCGTGRHWKKILARE